ncbi:hypothetical protein BV25DRAFT_1915732 [Artomyces pyxidatus]|uniref:Uncharacterized protein n=1 Tax=Artomyces pyxidatus TaxID=48021 RepID=A0ACB8T548_9AGAM|nr:hypothetical protein BV25DRAFT_1915732 [Artomyces pyxidatus]
MVKSLLSLSLLALAAVAQGAVIARQDFPPQVTCTTVASGSLVAYTVDDTLPAEGAPVSLHFTSAASAILVVGGSGGSFQLQECNSTYLGYETQHSIDTTIYYGHIKPVDPVHPQTCLTVPLQSGARQPYDIFNNACSYNDDQSQTTQFWKVSTINPFLTFLGEQAALLARIQWKVVLGESFGEKQAIQITADPNSNATQVNVRFKFTDLSL